eukprot:7382167-Prymnesium_polylepis.8
MTTRPARVCYFDPLQVHCTARKGSVLFAKGSISVQASESSLTLNTTPSLPRSRIHLRHRTLRTSKPLSGQDARSHRH